MRRHPCDLPPLEYAPPKFLHKFEWVVFKAFGLILRFLPLCLVEMALRGLIALARVFLKKRMDASLASIQERLGLSGNRARQVLDQSLLYFGWNWMAQIRPWSFVDKQRIHTEGLEYLEQAQSEGRGTVIAAMHTGLWEAVPHAMKVLDQPLAITVAVQHNPLVDLHLNRTRTAGGYHHILHNRLGIRHTLRYLKEGGTLIVLADVDIGPGGVPLPFLGKPASTPKWPMELALRTNSQLLVGFSHFDKKSGQLSLHLLPLPEGDAELHDLGLRMNDAMSAVIAEKPEQWFWMQRRWKTPIEQCQRS